MYTSHWTPYFNFKSEYRVHVLGGNIAKIFRKKLNEKEEVPGIFIRNNENSQFYRVKLEKTPESVIEVVKSFDGFVHKNFAKPVYFTALDIGVMQGSREAVFIEANSAPGLNSETAKLYAKYLIENCPVFAHTKQDMKIAEKLREETKNMKINWANEH